MSASGWSEVLTPFLWLALAAFLAGFLSYLALRGDAPSARPGPRFAPQVSAAADDWNLPKRI